MADNKNDGKRLTGSFDDVLFSSSSDEKIAPDSTKDSQGDQGDSSFIADDAFGDVLFGDAAASKQASVQKTTPKPEPKPSPAKPNVEPPVVRTQPQPQPKPKPKPRPVPQTLEAEAEFIESDIDVTDALFSSEEDFEQATDLPSASNDKETSQEQVDEFAQDALFASEDELDKALDDDDESDEAEPEPDLTEALFDSDEDLDKALDAPVSEKETKKPEKPKLSIAEAEAQKRQQEQKHIRDMIFTEAMQNGSISVEGNNPTAVKLATSTINDLADLPEPAASIDYAAFDALLEQQKLAEQEAELAAEQESDFKQKAKRFLFKARDNLNEKVGADLVERTMPLNFAMLPQKPKSEVKELQTKTAMKVALTRDGANIHTNALKIAQQLHALNQCQLPEAERLQMLELLAPFIFEITTALEKHFYKKPYHPADKNYYLTAGRSLQMLQLATAGFKQLFASIYESNNFNYKRQEKAYQSISNNLFGLLFMRQKLLFLLNQSNDNADIKLMNTVFMAWLLYEPEASKVPQDITGFGQGSFEQCFMHYHLLLAFDGAMLSKRLHQAFLLHLKEQVAQLKLFDHQVLQFAQGASCLLLQERRSRFSYSVIESDTTIADVQVVLDVRDFLINAIDNAKQCQQLLVDQNAVFSEGVLAKLPAADALSLCLFEQAQLLSMLANKIKPKFTQYQDSSVDIVFGLEKSHAYLSGKKSIKVKNKQIPLMCQCKWQQLNSKGGVYLKTKHAVNLPWFDIGQVVLMLEDIADDSDSSINGSEAGQASSSTQTNPAQEAEKPKQKSLLIVDSMNIDGDQLLLSLKPLADAVLPIEHEALGAAMLAKTKLGSALVSAATWPLHSNQVYDAAVFAEQALIQTESLSVLTRQVQVQLIR